MSDEKWKEILVEHKPEFIEGFPCVDCGSTKYKDIPKYPEYVECQGCKQSKERAEVIPNFSIRVDVVSSAGFLLSEEQETHTIQGKKQSRLRRFAHRLLYSYISLRTTTIIALWLFTVCATLAVAYQLGFYAALYSRGALP